MTLMVDAVAEAAERAASSPDGRGSNRNQSPKVHAPTPIRQSRRRRRRQRRWGGIGGAGNEIEPFTGGVRSHHIEGTEIRICKVKFDSETNAMTHPSHHQ